MSVPSQNKRRVLFVDDDPRLLELMSEVMAVHSRGEWDILTADNASRAFALLQEHPADLAVVDVEMPVMDGVQMISLLHRGYPNVQKVALAGRVEESTRAACLANGAELDRKSTRLNSSHHRLSRMPSSA